MIQCPERARNISALIPSLNYLDLPDVVFHRGLEDVRPNADSNSHGLLVQVEERRVFRQVRPG